MRERGILKVWLSALTRSAYVSRLNSAATATPRNNDLQPSSPCTTSRANYFSYLPPNSSSYERPSRALESQQNTTC